MKITEFSGIGKPTAAGKKKNVSSSDGDFFGMLSASETETASASQAPSEVPMTGSMDALLALQEIPNNELAKRQAVQEGKGALETLERLRLDLLSGHISGNILAKLNDVSKLKKQFAGDSNLDSLIQDIELRAAVELAKLKRASGNN